MAHSPVGQPPPAQSSSVPIEPSIAVSSTVASLEADSEDSGQPSTSSVKPDPSIGRAAVDNSTAQSQSDAMSAVADAAVVPSKTKPPPRVWNGIFPFQELPPEIRNNIYHRALDWNRVQGPMDTLKHKIEAIPYDTVAQRRIRQAAWVTEHDALYRSRQTPSILLLCKHVTSEALSILQDITLNIDFKPSIRPCNDDPIFYVTGDTWQAKLDRTMPVFKWAMMSLPTIKQVKKAKFFIPSWKYGHLQPWFYLLAMCGIFKQGNSRLEELRIEFSSPADTGVGDMVWILDGRNKELLKILWKLQLDTNVHEGIVRWLDRMALNRYLTAVHTPI